MKLHTLLISFVALVLGLATTSTAQQPDGRRPTRVAATIVMSDSLAQLDAPFVITRQPGATPTDLIVVRSDVDPQELSDAIRGLLSARQASGDFPLAAGTFRVRPQQPRKGAGQRPALPWAARVLRDLRRAEKRQIRGVGQARAIEIWLPRQRSGNPR